MAQFGFVGGSYQARSLAIDAQRTVNLFPELIESGNGKSKIALLGSPGLVEFADLGSDAPIRCLWAGEERLFVVAGSKLYEIDETGEPENGLGGNDYRGDVGENTSPAIIFPNGAGTQILIISNGYAWVDNGTSVAKAAFSGGGDVTALTGCFLDGYGIVHAPFSKKFFLSALNDFTTWDPLDFQTQEAYPDNIYAILADHRELWTFGDQTIEVYRNEGDADIVFRTDPSAFIDTGIVATFSATHIPGMGPAWLGGDSRGRISAYRVQGFSPVRVSTYAVEAAWEQYTTVSDAISWVEAWGGHLFWVITFPTANQTWVYDVAMEMWHERAYGATLARHRGRCHAFVFGKHFVGDHTSGKIYQLDMDTYDDDGEEITRLRAAPHISEEDKRIFYHRLELDLETGEVANPEFTLDWSDDGGHTWSSGRTITAGAVSAYKHRALWRRMGSGRDRVFRVQSTAAMRHAWINAYLNASGGAQ